MSKEQNIEVSTFAKASVDKCEEGDDDQRTCLSAGRQKVDKQNKKLTA